MNVTGDSTDVTTYFSLRLSATGAEATGLDVTTFDLQYVRSGSAPAAKADATALAATNSAHADNKAIEIDATDQPGLYRVDWPDAAFAAGVREVILTVKVATCFAEHLRVSIDAPVGVVGSLGTQAKADVNAEVVDTLQTDTPVAGKSIVDALTYIGASAAGEVSGAGSGTETFLDFAGDPALEVTVDEDGNRTAVIYG